MALIHCPNCDKEISDKADACPKCGYSMEKSVMCICPECGQKLSQDASDCPFCGYPLAEEKNNIAQKPYTALQPRPHKRKWILLGIIGVLMVIAMITAAFFLGRKQKNQDIPAIQQQSDLSSVEEESAPLPQSSTLAASETDTEPNENQNDNKQTENQKADFRNVNWGVNPEEVKSAETEELVDTSDDGITYATTLSGYDVTLAYFFNDDGQLYQAMYVLDEKHSSDNLYLSDYEALQRGLTEKYGDPDEEKDVWLDDLYKDNPQKYGFAVAVGHYVRKSCWNLDNTEIDLIIMGDNFDITVAVQYKSNEIMPPKDDYGL